jgi:cellulose synthase/poly-beta-1,6-N-acetylglucosamine synthase-like glycosyltransferase
MWRKPPPEEDMQPGMGEGANQLQPMRSPRVVFGLPAYNHAHKLRETLDSLLAQTERRFCIIASDDQSTDETPEILAEYASRDDRLIHRRSESRRGDASRWRAPFIPRPSISPGRATTMSGTSAGSRP